MSVHVGRCAGGREKTVFAQTKVYTTVAIGHDIT